MHAIYLPTGQARRLIFGRDRIGRSQVATHAYMSYRKHVLTYLKVATPGYLGQIYGYTEETQHVTLIFIFIGTD